MKRLDFLLEVVTSVAVAFLTLPAEVGVRMTTIAFSSVVVIIVVGFLTLLRGVAERCVELLVDFLLLGTGPHPFPPGVVFTFS